MKIKNSLLINKAITIIYSISFVAFILVSSLFEEEIIIVLTDIFFNLTSLAFGIYILTSLAKWLDKIVKGDKNITNISNKMRRENKLILFVKYIWIANLVFQIFSMLEINESIINLSTFDNQLFSLWILQAVTLSFFFASFLGILITSHLISQIQHSFIQIQMIEELIIQTSISVNLFKFDNVVENVNTEFLIVSENEHNIQRFFSNGLINLIIESKNSILLSNDKKATTPPILYAI